MTLIEAFFQTLWVSVLIVFGLIVFMLSVVVSVAWFVWWFVRRDEEDDDE